MESFSIEQPTVTKRDQYQGYDHNSENNLTMRQKVNQSVGVCYFNMGNLVQDYKEYGTCTVGDLCTVPHEGNNDGETTDGTFTKVFEANHGNAPGTGWTQKDHQLQDDCGKIQQCEIHDDKVIYKQIECGKVNNQAEAHFETFSGPCGSVVSLNNNVLTTPCFKIKRDDCKGPSSDKQNEVYSDINQAKTLYYKTKNAPSAAPGINIVLNNEVNASSSNNISNAQTASPTMNMNAAPTQNQAAPTQVGMAAAEGGRASGASVAEQADEMATCKEGPMGFQIDWNATTRVINKVNAGSWAEKKELQVGDTVLAVNNEDAAAKTKDELVQLLASVRPLKLAIKKKVDVPDTF